VKSNTNNPDILLTICPPWGVLNPPLGLAYIAQSLEEHGHNVEIYDLNILLYLQVDKSDQHLWKTKNDDFWRSPQNIDTLFDRWQTQIDSLTDHIATSKPTLIGCSIVDPNEHFSSRILSIIKEKNQNKIIIGGGPGCNDAGQRQILDESSRGAIDYFIIGEGEQSIPKLVSCLKEGTPADNIDNVVTTRLSLEYNQPIVRPNINNISPPTFKPFDLDLYGRKSLAVMWSRGCIGRCLYCKERALWGPYRMRPAQSIIEELDYFIKTLKITNFVIYDSAVNGNPQLLSEVCDEIIRKNLRITWSGEAIALKAMDSKLLRKMHRAGCHTLVYGIESGSDKILSSMRKLCDTNTASQVIRRTHEAGIKVAINILVGFPGESEDDFQKTIDFLINHSQWIDRLDGVSTLQIVSNTPLERKTTDFGIVLPSATPHDKWFIPNSNTFEIRQQRLARILEIAGQEGFEVGRTFLSDDTPSSAHTDNGLKAVPYHLQDDPEKQTTPEPSSPTPDKSAHCFPEKQTETAHSKNILIVTCQSLPIPGEPTTGGSLRAHNLGEALKKCGHQVLFSIPNDCLTTTAQRDQWQVFSHDGSNISHVIHKTGADLVLFCNWGLACAAGKCDIPAVIDMNGPLILENFYRNRGKQFSDSMAKLEAIAKTDFIIAGSKSQKAYLTAWCLMAGLDPDKFSIGIVPFSLSPKQPESHKNKGIRFILAGYNWPWLKGEQQVRAVCEQLSQQQDCSLHLYTSAPPYSDVINEDSSSDALGDLMSLELPGLVKHKPLPFSQLTDELAKGTVALDLWQQNPERDLAFPSRTVAYLWAGLPVITSPHGELSELIQRYQAGWLIESNDLPRLQELTREIATGGVNIEQYRKNTRKLFADHLSRDKTIKDLDTFCRTPFFNRSVSPFVAKYYFSKEHSLRLENQIKRDQTRMQLWTREVNLMQQIQRRPKGLTVLQSGSSLWRRYRRLIVGFPALVYMTTITLIGHGLHLLWIRRDRS